MRGPVVKGPELYLLITSPLIVCLYSHAMKRFTREREREREREGGREGGRYITVSPGECAARLSKALSSTCLLPHPSLFVCIVMQ